MSNEGQENAKKVLLEHLRAFGPLTKRRFVALGIPKRDIEAMIKNGILVQEEHPTKVLYKVADDEQE